MSAENKTGKTNKNSRRKKRLPKIIKAFIRLMIPVIIIAALVITGIMLLFRIKSFNVKPKGELPYTAQEITDAAQSFRGKNIIFLDISEVKDLLELRLPKLGNVTVSKKLPSTVIISAGTAVEKYAVESGKRTFALTDESLRVIEIIGEIPEGTALIEGLSILSVNPGETLLSKDDTSAECINEISSIIKEEDIENVLLINIENKNEIYLLYDGRIIVDIGDSQNLSGKLSLAVKSLEKEDEVSRAQYGILDVSHAPKAVFSPKDYNEIDKLTAYYEMMENIQEEDTEETSEPEDGAENTTESAEETTQAESTE